ncbi:hypothetical protein IDZ49_10525, partial [Francisella tularensis]|nr:hypothetical protein [Francisella tularensis]
AITTRGFKEKECELVDNLLADVVFNCGDEKGENETAAKVLDLCDKIPVYNEILNLINC